MGEAASMILRFEFFLSFLIALSSYDGAITTSVKISANCSLTSTVTGRFKATIPPNAETGSHSCAALYASSIVLAVAAPQGLACFTTTADGSSSS